MNPLCLGLFQSRLNIQDIVMSAPAAAAAKSAEPEAKAEEPVAAKTSFKLTLTAFDPAAKAKLIKEIKGIVPGLNLIEAKKYVESLPKVIKEEGSKEECEKLKAVLEGCGGKVSLE